MSKEYEKLLQDLLNEETDADIAPESRLEAYLLALLEKAGNGGGGSGSGLPIVDLTEAIAGGGAVPEDVGAALDAYAELKMPVIIQINAEEIAGMGVAGVLNYICMPVSEDVIVQMYVGELTVLEDTMAISIAKGYGSDQWAVMM